MRQAGLRRPEFMSTTGEFRIILRKQYTASELEKMGLNERQIGAVLYMANAGRITNREYQDRWSVSRVTAFRELAQLVEKQLFLKHGHTGKSTFYTLAKTSSDVS